MRKILTLILKDPDLRRRVLFVFAMLALFRLAAIIPIPGVDAEQLRAFFSGSQLFGLLNIFSGGALDNLSVVMLGVGPYITASIIMQLLTMIFPHLKEMYQEEGEAGRQRFNQYSRYLTVPLAALQGFGLLMLLERQGVLGDLTSLHRLINIVVVVAGSVFLMWLGELISEYGIGNGVSLMIFAGIVSSIPGALRQALFTFDASQIPTFAGFFAAAFLIIAGVVIVSEGERPIPVSYAKRIRGMRVYGGASTYLPLRVNQAGVIPIIFALSILLFPQMIMSVISNTSLPFVGAILGIFSGILNNSWVYAALYFALVFAFTYFYTAVTFDPDAISSNLQKNGAFVPGVRPGRPTAYFLSRIITRITFIGALFLGIIAVLPLIMRAATGFTSLAIGGTGLLIVVSVVLETAKQMKSQIVMREYA